MLGKHRIRVPAFGKLTGDVGDTEDPEWVASSLTNTDGPRGLLRISILVHAGVILKAAFITRLLCARR